jgi:hypothetical protein
MTRGNPHLEAERPCTRCSRAADHARYPADCAFCRGRADRPLWMEAKVLIEDVEIAAEAVEGS